MANDISLKQWVENYRAGKYDSPDANTMINAGWFDWFCKTSSLLGRLKKLAPKVIWFYELNIVDPEKTYVFFKNNCPLIGSTYDDFRICDLKTGDIIFTIIPKSGHKYEEYPASIWGLISKNKFDILLGAEDWRTLRKKIEENLDLLKKSMRLKYRSIDERIKKEEEGKRKILDYLRSLDNKKLRYIFKTLIQNEISNFKMIKYNLEYYKKYINKKYEQFVDYTNKNLHKFTDGKVDFTDGEIALDDTKMTEKLKEIIVSDIHTLDTEELIENIFSIVEKFMISLNQLKEI